MQNHGSAFSCSIEKVPFKHYNTLLHPLAFRKEQKGKENKRKEAAEKRKLESSDIEQDKKQKADDSMEEVHEEMTTESEQ